MKPVYIINGFLESGKTSFFAYTIGQPYFRAKGLTLLISCEEGTVGSGPTLLSATKTVMENIENEEDFTPAKLMELDSKYHPERILIEWNGMWNYRNMRIPHSWSIEQQITTIDASTFSVYFTNMKSLLAEQIRSSELIMFNRCDDVDENVLHGYKRNVKAINPKADLIFEDKEGEIDMTTEEDLPFDINNDPIMLEGINFGIWYIDAMEHPDRYAGKTVRYTGQVMKPPDLPKDSFIPGRPAMTCCAQDMSFIGFPAKSDRIAELKEHAWIDITADVAVEDFPGYDRPGVVLKVKKLEATEKPEHPVIDFSQQA